MFLYAKIHRNFGEDWKNWGIQNYPEWTVDCSIIWAYQYPIKGFDTPSYVIADSFDLPFDKHSALCGKFIDCGTNEELFPGYRCIKG